MRRSAVLVVLGAVLLAVPIASSRPGTTYAVERVSDGDTIVLATGQRVRLVQIDAPELSGSECYAVRAKSALTGLLPAGTRVRLEFDSRLDRVDRYGRSLAYVLKGSENVNVTLVARGAASVWFYEGVRGGYAGQLMTAARSARAAKRGLWKACSGTVLDPLRAVNTGSSASSGSGSAGGCDASYPDTCIPPPPPDLNCADIRRKVRVRQPDPHHLDGDRDGWGCESYG
jgi:endonuclease YncB( thermonuclease family)